MTQPQSWIEKFDAELAHAKRARREGNQGLARVCARRAAGAVITAYFKLHEIAYQPGNVLRAFSRLEDLTDQPKAVRELARHMGLRITEDHVLPENVDLIADAEQIRAVLFGGE